MSHNFVLSRQHRDMEEAMKKIGTGNVDDSYINLMAQTHFETTQVSSLTLFNNTKHYLTTLKIYPMLGMGEDYAVKKG